MNTLEENKALVRRLVNEVINEGDTYAIDELFAPELAPCIRRLFGSFRSAFPDWREEIVELVAEGDRVAGRFKCHGTHRGEFLGTAPTGRRQEVDEVLFLRVEGGRFVDFWALEDDRARSRQLGLTGHQSEGRRLASSRPARRGRHAGGDPVTGQVSDGSYRLENPKFGTVCLPVGRPRHG